MIVTLKISLGFGLYAKEGWQCVMEIDSASTLEDLHLAIQYAVNFENDHLYEFYISRTARGRMATAKAYQHFGLEKPSSENNNGGADLFSGK